MVDADDVHFIDAIPQRRHRKVLKTRCASISKLQAADA